MSESMDSQTAHYQFVRPCRRYYLRTKSAADAIKFTVDQQSLRRKSDADAAEKSAVEEPCLSCGA